MQGELRCDGGREFGKAEILHDDGVYAAVFQPEKLACGVFDFTSENQGVHGDETFHAVAVEEFHQLGQVFFGEIIGTQSRIEAG